MENNERTAIILENHEGRIARLEERMLSVEKMTEKIESLTLSVHEMSYQVNRMVDSMAELNNRVSNIEKEPADKWKSLVSTAIGCIVTAVVVFVLTKAGLK